MGILLWLIAVALVIYGVITLINGSVLLGIVLIIVGLAVGPGGWSIFNRRGSRV
ncbi:MAG: GPGG-motif small membrane protein [Aeromicrobium sp.]